MMLPENVRIRSAEPGDAGALLSIYAPYVQDTAITFEYEAPSEEEFKNRIIKTLQKYPYLVLEKENSVMGYAYANVFKARAAYDWAVETTVYLQREARGKGFGRLLYTALEEELTRRNFLNAYACISYTEKEDEYLDLSSPKFHAAMGYKLCGVFKQCGYKFGRWYDMIWMEKHLREHTANPLPIITE